MSGHNQSPVKQKHHVSVEVLRAAQANPNGWVYKIDGAFGDHDKVPPEAIVGAWKVNAIGELTGEFLENPNYRPRARQ